MIDKVRLGIPFFDNLYGGVYRNRPVLCCGRHDSGKTILALHCLMQAIKEGEQALLLSSWRANDLAIVADKTLGASFEDAISSGKATLLEYEGIMTDREFEENATLPPDCFAEFMQIIDQRAVTRIIIDTVLPWVAIRQKDRLNLHVFSFMQALERMKVTTILTLPQPVSPLAFTLKKLLIEQVPIALNLDLDAQGHRALTITKHLGEPVLPPPLPFRIVTGDGMVAPQNPPTEPPPANEHPPAPDAPPAGTIRFSDAFRT